MPVERKSFTGTEIRAGLMVLISGIILLAFIAAILKYRPQVARNTYYVTMSDIAGLDRAAEVRFGGMVVGRVSDIGPNPDNRTEMRITAKVNDATPVNADSRAYIGQISLTSEKHLEITTGSPDASLLPSGSKLGTTAAAGMFGDLSELTNSVQHLIADVQVLLGVSDGMGNRTRDMAETRTIADIFAQLDGVMSDLRLVMGVTDDAGNPLPEADRRTINELMANLDGTLDEGKLLMEDVRGVLDENRDGIKDLLAEAKDLSESAGSLVENMDDLLADNRENIDATLDSTREAVAKVSDLMADVKQLVATLNTTLERNGPGFEETIETLNNTLRNLEELTRTLADQPQAIIRGKEPVGRQ